MSQIIIVTSLAAMATEIKKKRKRERKREKGGKGNEK